ncbi:ABC transporter permease [bacterium]|nr:ABC transporter permease [bacterium]
MLGIIIGVASVLIIMAIGAGAQSLILSEIESLCTDKVGISPGKSDDSGPPTSMMGIVITTLTYEDALAIKKEIDEVKEMVVYSNENANVTWGSSGYSTSVKGTTVGYLEVEKGKISEGNFFTERQEKDISKVAILGSTVKKELFGESRALGETIKIQNHPFKIIGILEERGTVVFQNYDDQILIPVKTMQKIIKGVDYVDMIRTEVEENKIDQARERIGMLLRDRHKIEDSSGDSDDFTVRSSEDALNIVTTITNALRYFLTAMAALSLFVGGIGIMNIMLVNVTKRTKEIGLRKSIGANNGNIVGQFLVETIIITSVGGIIGMIIGIIISYLTSLTINGLGYNWEFSVSLMSILLGLGVSMGIGLIFGLYPAKKASDLSPIEALRYE